MRTVYGRTHGNVAQYVVVLLASTLLLVMFGGRAVALGEPTTELPSSSNKGVVSASLLSQTSGGYYSPKSQARLYIPIGSGPTTITLGDIGQGKLSHFTVGFVSGVTCNTFSPIAERIDIVNGFNSNSTLNIPSVAGIGGIQRILGVGGQEYGVLCVIVSSRDGLNQSLNNFTPYATFKLSTPGGNLLGVFPSDPGFDEGTGFASNHSGIGVSAANRAAWSESINFATKCGETLPAVLNRPIELYDLDIPSLQTGLRVRLQSRDRYDPNPGGYSNVSLENVGSFLGLRGSSPSSGAAALLENQVNVNDNNETWRLRPVGGVFSAHREYRLTVTGIDGNNLIRIKIPHPQVNSTIKCDPPVRLECVPNVVTIGVNDRFRLTLTLVNDNALPVDVTSVAWSIPGPFATPSSGSGSITTGGSATIVANGSATFESDQEIVIGTTGKYDAVWTVNTTDLLIDPDTGDCVAAGVETVIVRRFPYVRFYGNDVIAGGGYGSSCTPGLGEAKAAGRFGFSGPQNHSTYVGSASELAVFAVGQIQGVLPGAQTRGSLPGAPRDNPWDLSFANTDDASGSILKNTGLSPPRFGGGFDNLLCAEDLWANKPDNSELTDLNNNALSTPILVVPSGIARQVDLSSLPEGKYRLTGELHLFTSSTVPNGRRFTIYVDGTTVIGSSRSRQTALAYSGAGWSSTSDIPLVQVITRGSVYIDDNITQVDGFYAALPNGTPNTGEIHTCSLFNAGLNLTVPVLDQAVIARNCGNKLTVTGALVAQKVHLLRINGHVGEGPVAEGPGSATIAEVFQYSPEMYLALFDEGLSASSKNTLKLDSILSLPPAF